MNAIYKHASYILAIPDLHKKYLKKNTANKEVLDLMVIYKETIYKEIYYYQQHHKHYEHDHHEHRQGSFISMLKNMVVENEDIKMNEDIKKIYQFLAYLLDDWANRVWVISEYQIAKQKYKKYGTPLKYMFTPLFMYQLPLFSYRFDDDDDDQQYIANHGNANQNNKAFICQEVSDPKNFNQFVKSRFMQRTYLDMILNSNATRNEDRFNAILPSWDKYKHLIKNVSDWHITDMTSVRLKLYEIMEDDLWGKATLLYACSIHYPIRSINLPSFASIHDKDSLELIEKEKINIAYDNYENTLLENIQSQEEKEEKDHIKKMIYEHKMNSMPIWNENLISIQLKHQFPYHYLSVKSNTYFIKEIEEWLKKDIISAHSLLRKYGDCLHYVCIPFFIFTVPDYIDVFPSYGSVIYLLGNIDKNKWILHKEYTLGTFESIHFCTNDYTFNIY
ncbi:unnamed protein product [Cunninghamella blakesleeana]